MGKKQKKKSQGVSGEKAQQRKEERAEKQRLKRARRKGEGNEWKSNWKAFATQLRSIGLILRDIRGDGNCLFRSLADQLEGNQENHAKYRREVVEFMESNPDDFMPFVEEDFLAYCRQMRREGEWGGNLELAAAARAFVCHITVHQLHAPRLEIKNYDNPAANVIHLSYHDNEHYSSVRVEGDVSHRAAEVKMRLPDSGESPQGRQSTSDPSGLTFGTKKERIVHEITGCTNVELIRQTLRENWDDIDATVEYLVTLKTLDVENFYADTPTPAASAAPKTAAPPKPKGMDPCPCASGKKYKRCCGRKPSKAKKPRDASPSPGARGKKPKAGKTVRVQNLSNKQRKELQRKQREEAESRPKRPSKPSVEEDVPVQDFGSLTI